MAFARLALIAIALLATALPARAQQDEEGRRITRCCRASAGFGDTKPVADNATAEGRAANRRVELVKK